MIYIDQIRISVERHGDLYDYLIWVEETVPGLGKRRRTIKDSHLPRQISKKEGPLTITQILQYVTQPPKQKAPLSLGTPSDQAMGTASIPVQKWGKPAGVSN